MQSIMFNSANVNNKRRVEQSCFDNENKCAYCHTKQMITTSRNTSQCCVTASVANFYRSMAGIRVSLIFNISFVTSCILQCS